MCIRDRCERLGAEGGAAAAAADAMTDRVALVAEADEPAALALAMLLELEVYARVLPASFAADASEAERAARALLQNARRR